jgi:fibronectin type 3 domain-containing protein
MMTKRYLYTSLLFLLSHWLLGQVADSPVRKACIEVIARPSQDSIMLRWAPLSFESWSDANKSGYVIERFTMTRRGQPVSPAEVRTITVEPLRAWPLAAWEPLVKRDRYAAIAAQALYGSTFDIDMGKSSVFQIVNKAKENEQRFHFALFSADMSTAVARASGLLFADKQIKKDEKYLYRISIAHATQICQGSVFTGADQLYQLPVVAGVKAVRKDNNVMIEWQRDRLNLYTAYQVERSTDGKKFTSISDESIVNVSPTEEESSSLIFVSDSVAVTGRLWYRVVGITPFGEKGPEDEPVEASTEYTLGEPPYVTEAHSNDNKKMILQWRFTDILNDKIKGFHIDRAGSPSEKFKRITGQLLSPQIRTYTDIDPGQVNYYKVTAIGLDNHEYSSPLYLAQLVDSIPPSAPIALAAAVDDFGNITLQWKANQEPDVYGYRVYRSNYRSEESSQVTTEPIKRTSYSDKINLNTLNHHIYYQVMAIDRNQNHSPLSQVLEVKLPDKVKPVPPVFLPVHSTDKGVELQWQPSSSDDVVKYDLYKQAVGDKQWIRITSIPSKGDSIYSYRDENMIMPKYSYTVVAIDSTGLESDPALAVTGNRIESKLKPSVTMKQPVVNRETKQVVLSWSYDQQGVESYRVFRAIDAAEPVLYRTIPASSKEFTDKTLMPGRKYSYRIMAVFTNQSKSQLSNELIVNF